eukprot:1284184-Pyramimonas_sp.AAC.1
MLDWRWLWTMLDWRRRAHRRARRRGDAPSRRHRAGPGTGGRIHAFGSTPPGPPPELLAIPCRAA